MNTNTPLVVFIVFLFSSQTVLAEQNFSGNSGMYYHSAVIGIGLFAILITLIYEKLRK